MPHYEWGPLGVTEPQFWHQEYQEVLARNAGDSRYTDGITYVDLFRSDADEIVVQYWFFYPFNDSGNRHEGDWEHINVVLNSIWKRGTIQYFDIAVRYGYCVSRRATGAYGRRPLRSWIGTETDDSVGRMR